jgi:hypothetical protein
MAAMTPDEAKAILDRFVEADSSLAAIAAVAKQFIDQVAADAQALSAADKDELAERRAREQRDRENDNAYRRARRQRHPTDVRRMSDGCPTDAVSTRARSSSSSLESKKEGGGGDARARAIDVISEEAETITNEITRILTETNHQYSGRWGHSAVAEQIERRFRLGQRAPIIIDAVRKAAREAAGKTVIHSFVYFDKAIARAHSQAIAEPTLPLDGIGTNHGPSQHTSQREAVEFGDRIIERLRRTNISGGG